MLKDSTTGNYIPLALDPFYFLRLAEILLEQGAYPVFDVMRAVPIDHGFLHELLPQFLVWIHNLMNIFGDFKFVPITMNPIYFDAKTCKEIGEKIFEASKKLNKKILIIASSDFTHYGSMYDYTPFRNQKDVVEKVKEMDMQVIRLINKMEPKKVLKICDEKRLTICGYGCIASMIFAAKEMGAREGKLINYSTSFDISKDISAIVGYAGIQIS